MQRVMQKNHTIVERFLKFNFKNIVIMISIIISMSVWISYIVALPNRMSSFERRISTLENNQVKMSAVLNVIYTDVRDIKNILMKDNDDN